ncbi:hypothetical protein C8J55DRAFT_559698 [Lentinula edodes]|uniref:Uncharacterized protein n=1 Tax=Lentinula lateritia TaxID=40482 RepID=A0A9W9DRE2_9AGAR|nr:hypothetical protein C8J55DRAFT_559698 [Lentinula edodes]
MSYTGSMVPKGFEDNEVWHVKYEKSQWLVYCQACKSAGQTPYHAKRHSGSGKHKENVARMKEKQTPSPTGSPHHTHPAVPISSIYDLAATRLLQSLDTPNTLCETLPPLSNFQYHDSPESSLHISDLNSINWAELDFNEQELGGSHEVESRQALSSYMLNIFAHGPDDIHSDNEFDGEHSESDSSDSSCEGDAGYTPLREDDAFNPANLNYKHPRTDTSEKSREWFPWPNRIACTLDILMHLPHSTFSVRQLELFLWLLKVNGVEDATSVKTMKELDTKLQKLYGIQTYKYKGAVKIMYTV